MAALQAKLHIPNGYILPHSDAYYHGVNDNLELWPTLKFWIEDSAEWTLEGDSVCGYTPAQWRLLLAAPGVMDEFGDVYGSHVDNGIVSIQHKNGRLEFAVDGARGGKMRWSLPIELCRDAIEHIVTRIEIHLAVQATEPFDE